MKKKFFWMVRRVILMAAMITGGASNVLAQTADDYFSITKSTEQGGTTTDYYTNLGTALNYAANGDVIKLLKNYTTDESVEITKSITLDLNDHDIIGNRNGYLMGVGEYCNLTLVDNGADPQKKGSVTNNTTSDDHETIRISGGTLVATGVSIACPHASAIYNAGTAIIDGCDISGYIGIYVVGTTTVSNTVISDSGDGIYFDGGSLTIGSGVSISQYARNGIFFEGGTLIPNAWPTFSKAGNGIGADIVILDGNYLSFGEGNFSAPEKAMSLRVVNRNLDDVDLAIFDYPITVGYTARFTEGGSVIDPNRVFRWYNGCAGIGFSLDDDGVVNIDFGVASVTVRNVDGTVETIFYSTFDNALSAAKSGYYAGDGNTPKFVPTLSLFEDINLSGSRITLGSSGDCYDLVLNLNGHTLSSSADQLITVNAGYSMTIVDSGGGGCIKNYDGYVIGNGGSLTWNSGTIAAASICIYNTGTMTVSGGTVDMSSAAIGIYSEGVLIFNGFPTFDHGSNGNCTDIKLSQNKIITFGAGTFVVPEDPIIVNINNRPYTFTSGYSANVKSGEAVIDPADIFTYLNVNDGYIVCMNDKGLEARIKQASAVTVSLKDDADNSDVIVHNQLSRVTLSGRTLINNGTWNTLCLPFDVTDHDATDNASFSLTPFQGAIVKELDVDGTYYIDDGQGGTIPSKTGLNTSTGELTLYFKEATTIKAGKPYIIKWNVSGSAGYKNPVFYNVVLKDKIRPVEFPGGAFVGQFSPFSIVNAPVGYSTEQGNVNEILFFATGDATGTTILGYSAGERTLRSCRAHFYVPSKVDDDGQPVSAVRSMALNFGDGAETAIRDLRIEGEATSKASTGFYTLDGLRLSAMPTAKGIYIHNGKKIIIK